MQQTLLYTHLVIGILFIISVLVQDKGVGFGTAVGGAAGAGVYTSQRGAAKLLHRTSVVLAVLFLLTALVYVVVPPAPVDTSGPQVNASADASLTSPELTVEPSTEATE